MIIGFVFFLGIWRTTVRHFAEERSGKTESPPGRRINQGVNNSATQEKTKTTTTTQDKRETETTAQMKRTMSESATYNGTSKLTSPIKGNIILPYSVK